MPRSFLIKKSPKLVNNSFTSNINTSYQPNGCTDDDNSQPNNNHYDSNPSCDERGPFDLSIKSRLLKEANTVVIKTETLLHSEKAKENSLINCYTNAQYRDSSLYTPQSQSATSAKCLSPQLNGDLSKALIPLEPLHTTQPHLSPSSQSRHYSMAPFVSFGFPTCYNDSKNLVTSPSHYYHQTRHHDYPISPPQTPILSIGYSSNENNHRITVISPVSEYRPQFMSTWNDHISLKPANGSVTISSPTPSLNGSDDSGRGSVHSRGSGNSLEVSKYQDSFKTDVRTTKSRKPVNGSSDTTTTRYHCEDCNKSYSTCSGLTKHREFHCATQAKKAFSCKHCDKVYVSLGALKMHIRTHTLPCKCKLCGKAFSRPWLLQGHIRTHTGEKPFACQYCSRAFADRSNLRAHLQTHSDVKKYSCKTCSKTFSRMSLLLKHEDGGCANHRMQ